MAFMARGIYVTGTDTDVGKTAVTVAIVRSLVQAGKRVGVYKPVATGGGHDPQALWEAAGRPLTLAQVCPQLFPAPISPPRSGRAAGTIVDDDLLERGLEPWMRGFDVVVVEGAGGLFSPLSDTQSNADLARRIGLPLVVVDSARLGAIGRTLSAVTAARSCGLAIAAVVLSQTVPLTGSPDDPASPWRIAHDSRADLAAALAPLPVAMLAHGDGVIAPPIVI